MYDNYVPLHSHQPSVYYLVEWQNKNTKSIIPSKAEEQLCGRTDESEMGREMLLDSVHCKWYIIILFHLPQCQKLGACTTGFISRYSTQLSYSLVEFGVTKWATGVPVLSCWSSCWPQIESVRWCILRRLLQIELKNSDKASQTIQNLHSGELPLVLFYVLLGHQDCFLMCPLCA